MTFSAPLAAPETAPGIPSPSAPGLNGPDLTAADFARIAALAHRTAGLAIGTGKSAMVRTRLARRLRALGLASFEAYCRYLDSPEGSDEIGKMVSELTTNVSHFFREGHHFDLLRSDVLPPLAERARAGERVRIWSAGCANGQEPYSIVMAMIEAGMPMERDVRVLATDIDPKVIAHARKGLYPETMLSGLPDAMRARFFTRAKPGAEPAWQAGPALRDAVHFGVLNLLDAWPMRGRFDAIFCRNVVIYFDTATQERLWQRFTDQLTPDGWLFIGHSERLSGGVQPRFQGRGITAYQLGTPAGGLPPAAGEASMRN
ncbi:MAG: chemotaxis protein [Rhodobacterales bacterium]|nr:MAG: chemotaxis protein [Rhodobacterales bacterium]